MRKRIRWMRFRDRLKEYIGRDGCWEWPGALDADGYGRTRVDGRKEYAHRAAYWILVRPIPDGLQMDHLCRNRRCFNPEHLEPVTPLENTRRGDTWKNNGCKTHCPHGHPYEGDNCYIHRDGSRRCRACRRIGMRKDRRAA